MKVNQCWNFYNNKTILFKNNKLSGTLLEDLLNTKWANMFGYCDPNPWDVKRFA